MGHGGSKVLVHVQLDAAYYCAGDHVTGTVVLHTEQSIDAKAISCKITGVEKTKWIETRHNAQHAGAGSSTPTQDVTHKGKHVIFKAKVPLAKAALIQPGDYQWPFSFDLPANIPGSFSYEAEGNRTWASVEYKVKAVVDQEGFLKSDFKRTLTFNVLRSKACEVPINGPPGVVLRQEQPISAWCCFNKGIMDMTVSFASPQVQTGDSIMVNVQVNNQSSATVELVEAKLHQRLEVMGDIGTSPKKVDTVRAVSRQQAINGAGGAPGTTSEYICQIDLWRVIQGMRTLLEATCTGKIIKSTYELEVTAKTGCCLSEVRIRGPVYINDPPPHTGAPSIRPPANWAPMVYPTTSFAIQCSGTPCNGAGAVCYVGQPSQQQYSKE